MLHHPFQCEAVVRVGCVDPGQGIGEGLGVVLLGHCVPVDGSGCQQATVFIECLRDRIERPKAGRDGDVLAIEHLAGGAFHRGLVAGRLDAERVVAVWRHRGSPCAFDGPLRHRDGRGHCPTQARGDRGTGDVGGYLAEMADRGWQRVRDERSGGKRIVGGAAGIDAAGGRCHLHDHRLVGLDRQRGADIGRAVDRDRRVRLGQPVVQQRLDDEDIAGRIGAATADRGEDRRRDTAHFVDAQHRW